MVRSTCPVDQTPQPLLKPSLRFTLVNSALVSGLYLVLQLLVSFVASSQLDWDPSIRLGDLIAVAITASALPCTAILLYILCFNENLDLRTWMALIPVRATALLAWVAFAIALLYVADQISISLGRTPEPPILKTIATTTQHTALLWFALVIAAPVFEELLFRGFLFEGLRRTKLKIRGTILATTLLWTLLHVGQYDEEFLLLIALIGLLLGYARQRSGSLYVPLAIHMVNNILSMAQMMGHRSGGIAAWF